MVFVLVKGQALPVHAHLVLLGWDATLKIRANQIQYFLSNSFLHYELF